MVDRSATMPVPSDDLRRRRRDLWTPPALLVGVALVSSAIGLNMREHEQVLDERGALGSAVVVEADDRGRQLDRVVVDYRVGALSFRTDLRVLDADDFRVGSTIAIRYDPLHPEHARSLEGSLLVHQLLLGVAVMAVVGAAIIALRTPRLVRADTAAVTSGMVTLMHGAPYRRVRGRVIRFFVQDLVGLWPDGADRARPPPLSVKVASGVRPVRPGPVTVVGRPEPGYHVVLVLSGHTVWTTGGLRAGVDRKARPGGGGQ